MSAAETVLNSDHLGEGPPLFPEEEWYEKVLRCGLYVGAAFQLLCILAVIVLPAPSSSSSEDSSGGHRV